MSSFGMQLIVLLGIWVFFLQSRVGRLENRIRKLEGRHLDRKLEREAERGRKHPEEESEVHITAEAETRTQPASQTHPLSQIDTTNEELANDPQQEALSAGSVKSEERSPLIDWTVRYFTGGNLLVRIGGVVLFFGLAFLAKYAVKHSMLSIPMRLGGIATIGLALIVTGWRLRHRAGAYGQILQGVGIATLYLTVFAAAKFYQLFGLSTAFVIMLAIIAAVSLMALRQNSLPMVLFATVGGFLVPILTSEGNGSHILLFGYYAVLDLGIFAIAWQRSWRVLNIVGFLFTFIIATGWGVLHYKPELFWTTEPFLLLYYAIYLTISILFTLKRRFEPRNLIDGTLVFGLPLVAFPLQIALVKDFAYGDAISALTLGTLYLSLAYLLRNRKHMELLAQSFGALAIVFYTIGVPYLFDADVSAALWSIEGATILWSALGQQKRYSRYFAQLLLFVSALLYPISVMDTGAGAYLGYLIVIVSALFGAYHLDRAKSILDPMERLSALLLTITAVLLWFHSTVPKLTEAGLSQNFSLLFALIAGAVLLYAADTVWKWRRMEQLLQGYLPLGLILYFQAIFQDVYPINPFGGQGAAAWILLNISGYYMLYRYDSRWKFAGPIHIFALWMNTLILTLEIDYLCAVKSRWIDVPEVLDGSVLVVITLALLLLRRYPQWLQRHKKSYTLIGAGGLTFAIFAYSINLFSLSPRPEGYLPIVNITDIMQIAAAVSILLWIRTNREAVDRNITTIFYAGWSLLSLVSISVIYARAIHIYRHIVYSPGALWQSLYFQTGLSLLWSMAGITLMLLSKRYTKRSWWIAGFTLLLTVVAKLFIVELSGSGTIERIVSFIAVGLLLLLIGYFVPLPPTEEDKQN